MNSLKTKHKILYGLMTLVFLSVWYCRDIFTSTYVKLQDAFAAERNAAGGWKLIGYTNPASNNFTYSGTGVGDAATVALTALNNNVGWQAQNIPALNECTANNGCTWKVTLANGTVGGQIKYHACQSTKAAPFTPNFDAISTPGATGCTVN